MKEILEDLHKDVCRLEEVFKDYKLQALNEMGSRTDGDIGNELEFASKRIWASHTLSREFIKLKEKIELIKEKE